MPKEIPPSSREILDIKTLSLQTKMRMILEIFDFGQGTQEEKTERKRKFLELIGNYNQAIIRTEPSKSEKNITYSDKNKKGLHEEIMSIIRTMSLSKDVDKKHRKLAEYLVHNRQEVERMVTSYFVGYDTAPNPSTYSPVKQARENPLYFSKPGKDD